MITSRLIRALALAALLAGSGRPTVFYAQSAASPGGYDPALFDGLKWRSIGPPRGGRSIAAAGSPSRALEYYFGAVGGGLWKTTDGGVTWQAVTDGQIKSSSVGAIVVADSNADVIYIGMGETCLRGNIMQGDGVYKSTDAGKSWTNVGLADTQAISRIRVHPTNADLVYVAAFGHPAGPSDERGIFRSKDGGKTWQRVLFRDNRTGAIDLAIDRRNPSVLYAALWEAYRVSWQMSSGGPGSGLFKSTDGGDTWTEITRNAGLVRGLIGRIGISVSGADSNRLYALIESDEGGVFRSDDGGANWAKVNDERKLRQRAFYYTHIYADPKDRDTVYALNTGFFKSTDGGKTFNTTIRVPHGDNHDLWIDPNDPRRMINSNDGGGNVSTNGGATWTDQDFATAQLYHVATTRDYPYHVCGAQQDNSTLCVPSDGGQFIGARLYPVGGGESGYIAPHPTDPDVFYAGSQGALLTRFDRRHRQTRDVQVYPRFFSGESAGSLKERWQWTFPIVFSPLDPKVLYASSQHLWRTTNDGQNWERISPDLTRADPKTLGDSGGPITKDQNGPEIYATIFAIAPSKHEKDTIWTGSDDGLVYITRDGGKNWTKITPPDLPEFARVSLIDASPHKPATAYLAAKRYQLDDRAPYIYRTDDYGKTWSRIVAGIPGNDYVHAVREDPKCAGLLYAGTEHGVYVSFDNGARWQSLLLNLPDTQVSDLVVEENDLVIATHGRSLYVLDDIAPLRQLSQELTTTNVHLYAPAPSVRRTEQAVIDYYLRQPAQKVTIDILDARGRTIRSFTGVPEDPKKAEASPGDDFFFGPPPVKVGVKAGMNRFSWDARYQGATTFPGLILWGASADRGPLAPPGTYQVRLAAAGQTLTRPVEIRKDPRLTGVSQADLEEQFKLAVAIRDKVSEANEAVIKIRGIKDQVKDRLGMLDQARYPKITAAADALVKKIGAVEEDLYQVRNRSNQDPLNFPIKLNNKIAALQRVVESADAKPTDQSYVVFKELSEELRVLLADRLEPALATDLAQLNKLLAGRKLAPIVAEGMKKTTTE